MSVQFEIHDNLANQPSEILDELLETPRLCMLLNRNLSKQQIGHLTDVFCIVPLEHEGEQRYAILCGFYLRPSDEVVEPQLHDIWQELAEEEEE